MKTLSFLSFSSLLLLASCGDDPELVKKRQEQKLEIARLEGENMLLNEQLNSLPPDRSEELKELKIKVDQQTQQLENLEQEIVQLEAKKRGAEADLERYKAKYPVTQ